jgi:hypothetical protein
MSGDAMSLLRRTTLVRGLAACLITALAGFSQSVRSQTPDEIGPLLSQLQQQEEIILDHRNWWLAQLNNPDVLFLPVAPDMSAPFGPFNPPVLLDRASAWEQAQRLSVAYTAMRMTNPPTAQALMQEMEDASRRMKDGVYAALYPAFESDLRAVRDEFQRLMGMRTQQGQTPTVGPAGRAWYFRRTVVGADQTNPDFQLLEQEADESGGHVLVSGRVPSTNCFETWEMSWRFGADVSRLEEGMQIPVTLQVRLTSAPCPSPLGSFIAVGGGPTERVIMNEAPSDQFQGAVEEQGDRCSANGSQGYATTQATLTVRGNPGQSNAWTVFRLQAYMPGQFWVIGYLYLAGGG